MLRYTQLDMTAEIKPWTAGASMDTPIKHDLTLNFDSYLIVDTE